MRKAAPGQFSLGLLEPEQAVHGEFEGVISEQEQREQLRAKVAAIYAQTEPHRLACEARYLETLRLTKHKTYLRIIEKIRSSRNPEQLALLRNAIIAAREKQLNSPYNGALQQRNDDV